MRLVGRSPRRWRIGRFGCRDVIGQPPAKMSGRLDSGHLVVVTLGSYSQHVFDRRPSRDVPHGAPATSRRRAVSRPAISNERHLAPGHRISSPGRVAQWESARFTRERSQVRNPPRPSRKPCRYAPSTRAVPSRATWISRRGDDDLSPTLSAIARGPCRFNAGGSANLPARGRRAPVWADRGDGAQVGRAQDRRRTPRSRSSRTSPRLAQSCG